MNAGVLSIFNKYPDWSQIIRQHYWHLRYARGFNSARIRKEYRRIEAEKKRLHDLGVDSELVRLLCRHLANLKNQKAEELFFKKLTQDPAQIGGKR